MIQQNCFRHLFFGIFTGLSPQRKMSVTSVLPEIVTTQLRVTQAILTAPYLTDEVTIIQRVPAGKPQQIPAGWTGKDGILWHPYCFFYTVFQRQFWFFRLYQRVFQRLQLFSRWQRPEAMRQCPANGSGKLCVAISVMIGLFFRLRQFQRFHGGFQRIIADTLFHPVGIGHLYVVPA